MICVLYIVHRGSLLSLSCRMGATWRFLLLVLKEQIELERLIGRIFEKKKTTTYFCSSIDHLLTASINFSKYTVVHYWKSLHSFWSIIIIYIIKLFLWIWCFNIKKCSWISYFKNIIDLFCLIFFYVSNIHHMQFFINSIFVQDSCASVGGWLVAIESKSENMFIKSRLNHEFGKYWFFYTNKRYLLFLQDIEFYFYIYRLGPKICHI